MKKLPFILIFFLSIIVGNAQENKDKIELKNGTILQGTISEIIPDSIITIKLVDGRIKTLKYSEIEYIKNNGKKVISPIDKKYYIKGNIGLLMGNTTYAIQKSFLFEASGGYKYKKWTMGLGTGINALYSVMYIPALGELEYTFNEEKTSPFINIQAGGIFNLSYKDDIYTNGYKNGKFIGGNVGLKHYVSDNLAMTFEAGYRYYKLGKNGEEYFYNQGDWTNIIYYPVAYNANVHRFSLKVGLVF